MLRLSAPSSQKKDNKSFNLSISFYKGITFFVAICVISFVGIQEIRNIATIESSIENILQDRLPEFAENQKTLVNIESLRRLAEVSNISESPKDRRQARIKVDALTAESIFDRDPGFQISARKISQAVKDLVAIKDRIYQRSQILEGLEVEFHNNILQLSHLSVTGKDFDYLLQINALNLVLDPFKKTLSLNILQQETNEQINQIMAIARTIAEQEPAKASLAWTYAENIKEILNKRIDTLSIIIPEKDRAQGVWEMIDTDLKKMRDNVTQGSEAAVSESLKMIKIKTGDASYYSMITYVIIIIIFLLYYVSTYFFIVKPLHLTSKKLEKIQEGDLNTPLPPVYITEIANIANLLDRFSVHLAELYQHANQLEEDSVKKRNLEEIMRAVFKVSLDGYIVWDSAHIITVSDGAASLLKLKSEEEILPYWTSHGPLMQKASEVFKNIEKTMTWREEIILPISENHSIPCEIIHLLINYNDEKCILSCIRDLREQKKNEMALVAAKEQAEAATKVKSEFLARMSHEIRTPMNGVIGLTRLALDSDPSPRQLELLEKIQASAQILLGVINDVLDFSKMEQDKLELEEQPFSLIRTFSTIGDLLELQADKKGIAFKRTIDQSLFERLWLKGDALRLSQVLLNLCSNAIKFTEKGEVVLSVVCCSLSDKDMTLSFSITDTGIGISPDVMDRLFNPFSQADSSTTRKYGGTGLGLVISKFLVEKMGGRISIQSQLGSGSTFQFAITLPHVDPLSGAGSSSEEILASDQSDNDIGFAGKRVLVAEDNEINQEIIISFLESLDIAVMIANNGQEALDILKEHDVDCIFMDIQMPVMDGLTAAREIRMHGRPEIRNKPIIAMTAHVMREDIDKSLDAGMNAHLTKPIDYTRIVDCLKSYFASSRVS